MRKSRYRKFSGKNSRIKEALVKKEKNPWSRRRVQIGGLRKRIRKAYTGTKGKRRKAANENHQSRKNPPTGERHAV